MAAACSGSRLFGWREAASPTLRWFPSILNVLRFPFMRSVRKEADQEDIIKKKKVLLSAKRV